MRLPPLLLLSLLTAAPTLAERPPPAIPRQVERHWPADHLSLRRPPADPSAALPPALDAALRARLRAETGQHAERIERILQRARRRLPAGAIPGLRTAQPRHPVEELITLQVAPDPATGGQVALLQLFWSQAWLGPPQAGLDCPPCPCSGPRDCAPCVPCDPETAPRARALIDVIGFTLAARYTLDAAGEVTAERIYRPQPLSRERRQGRLRALRAQSSPGLRLPGPQLPRPPLPGPAGELR